jgi:hypothetical protein
MPSIGEKHMNVYEENSTQGINLSPGRIPILRDYSRKISATINDEVNRGSNMNGMMLIRMVMDIPELTCEERMSLVWSITTDTSKAMYQDKFFRVLKSAMESL